ncbi:thiol-disulfide oxidoreductase DCC family protein [Chloroflexota bacterium]
MDSDNRPESTPDVVDDSAPVCSVVIFDGACGFCVESVWLVQWLDWRGRLGYLDAQDWPVVQVRYPLLEQAAVAGMIHVILPDGRVYAGFDAVRVVLRDLPLVAWLHPLLTLPGMTWAGRKVYHWVAARRYAISRLLGRSAVCDAGACRIVPPPKR